MKIHDKEIEEGNIEYKRFFENITPHKLVHLTAQMNWRINEGNGIAHYYLGICDNGTICKDLTQDRIDYSIDIIKMMVDGCNSYIETFILHRVEQLLWFDITVKRNIQYIPEYRILVKNAELMKIIKNTQINKVYYIKYYNNEKYLFFESDNINITKMIDFNMIINENININTIEELIEAINPYMKGNIIANKSNIQFNIIETHNIPSIGTVLYGFLKDGYIEKGGIINNIVILSIHYDMKDIDNVMAPAIISIRVIDKGCVN